MNKWIIFFLFSSIAVFAQEYPKLSHYSADSSSPARYQFCIAFEQGIAQSEIDNILNKFSARIVQHLNAVAYPIYVVEIEGASDPQQKKREIEQIAGVVYVTSENEEVTGLEIESATAPKQRAGSIAIKKPGENHLQNGTESLQSKYQRVVAQHIPGLHACVSKRNYTDKKQGAYALIELNIDRNGGVKSVRITKSNISDPKILGCFRKKARTWRDFPKRQSPSELKVKFNISY